MDQTRNISCTLEMQAGDLMDRPAIYYPVKGTYFQITFEELNRECNRLASGLTGYGLKRGMRTLVMVPPGKDFIALTFALFKIGAVPVLIDPGLGKRNLLKGIAEAEPAAMIGIGLAHLFRSLFPGPFKSVEVKVAAGSTGFGGIPLPRILGKGEDTFQTVDTEENDPAAILFTSGSTGPAKGVLYTHGMFLRQVEILRKHFNIRPGEVEMPTFPLFALFGTGMGMTCVIPEMDPTCPAKVDPQTIIRTVERFHVTSSFGSPALWDTVSRYCVENGVRLNGLKRILMAGAPVPGSLLKRFDNILDADANIFTPYGATESLPTCSIGHKEIVRETWDQTVQGKGTCVGKPVPGVNLKIIRICDDPILEWNSGLELPAQEIGEIIVSSPWVTHEYFRREEATLLAKIRDGSTLWHRMGDVGYLDESGRVWFCGRKSHRVVTPESTLFTIPCEAIFNRHLDVKRSALVGIGDKPNQRPVMIVEPEGKKRTRTKQERGKFRAELRKLGNESFLTREIVDVIFHPSFPVDIRHNAKIFRERLADWAAKKIT